MKASVLRNALVPFLGGGKLADIKNFEILFLRGEFSLLNRIEETTPLKCYTQGVRSVHNFVRLLEREMEFQFPRIPFRNSEFRSESEFRLVPIDSESEFRFIPIHSVPKFGIPAPESKKIAKFCSGIRNGIFIPISYPDLSCYLFINASRRWIRVIVHNR